jgi:hypothetical protein
MQNKKRQLPYSWLGMPALWEPLYLCYLTVHTLWGSYCCELICCVCPVPLLLVRTSSSVGDSFLTWFGKRRLHQLVNAGAKKVYSPATTKRMEQLCPKPSTQTPLWDFSNFSIGKTLLFWAGLPTCSNMNLEKPVALSPLPLKRKPASDSHYWDNKWDSPSPALSESMELSDTWHQLHPGFLSC